MTLILLLLLLLVLHVVFRNGCITGCLGLILAPFVLSVGAGALITVLEWIF